MTVTRNRGSLTCCVHSYEDERFDPAVDKKTGFRTKQMLCVPITDTVGEVIGALQVINTTHGEPFRVNDVELLKKFRGYVQVSILNKIRDASYHVKELLNILNMVTIQLLCASFELGRLQDADKIDLAFLSDKVVQLSNAARGTIFVLNERQGQAKLTFSIDSPGGKKEISIPHDSTSLAGACIIENEIINIPDW